MIPQILRVLSWLVEVDEVGISGTKDDIYPHILMNSISIIHFINIINCNIICLHIYNNYLYIQ